ncbi:MAG: diadenylate cyclase CdaA [candidate division WOR-3 bacterium]
MLSIFKPSFRDIIDIIIVAAIIFYFLKFLKGTRALRMLFALFFIFLLYFMARWLNLKTLTLIVDSLKAVWVVAFVILFQPEIRNALSRFGRARPLRFLLKPGNEAAVIEEVVEATALLKERKLGGLIVLERQMGLREFIETGTRIEALVSAPLLVSIFTPPSPLHDGACIITGDHIVSAGCTLPLSETSYVDGFLGMRHRAGLGITTVTDAVAIIVSETTGKISFANRGKLAIDLTPSQVKFNLTQAIIKGE